MALQVCKVSQLLFVGCILLLSHALHLIQSYDAATVALAACHVNARLVLVCCPLCNCCRMHWLWQKQLRHAWVGHRPHLKCSSPAVQHKDLDCSSRCHWASAEGPVRQAHRYRLLQRVCPQSQRWGLPVLTQR